MKKAKINIENKYNIIEIKKQIKSGWFNSTADLAEFWGIPYTSMRRILKAHNLGFIRVGKIKIKKNGQ